MNQDSKLNQLYKKRDNFYTKLLTQFIAIPLISIVLIFYTYWTVNELRIWIYGERTEIPIERLESGTDEYYLFAELGNSIVRKEIRKNTFDQLEQGTLMRIIYWESDPRKSIFLELNEKNQVFKLGLGVLFCSVLLLGTFKRIRTMKRDNPDKRA